MRRAFAKQALLGLMALGAAAGAALAGGMNMGAMAAPASTPLKATAALRDAAGQVLGTATFEQQGMGMRVTVRVSGLTPGQHGMHIHEFGRCTPGIDPATNTVVPFGGAGGHFDPGMSRNHDDPQAGNKYGHGGDLPMLTVGADGTGTATFTTQKSSLTGMNGVLNRSLVIHARPDDYKSDPAGMTGPRERCGVITRDNYSARDYPLPGPQDFPEGVAYDAKRGLLFTGSAATGTIYAINASTGAVSKFNEGGGQGRASSLGLKVDTRSRVWSAGGATGKISVFSPDGFPLAILDTPKSPNKFINDLAFGPDGSAYVTDSFRPVIFRVGPDLKLSAWLELGGTPIKYGPGINLNGIVATPDGRALLTIQLNTGELWRIDLRTRAVRKVMGGLVNGDGLLLDGRTLYVARNKDQVVSKVNLNADYTAGTLVAEEPVTGLRFPATLAAVGGDLVVTQSQLDKLQGGTPETPFKLTRFKKF
ncbi:superoxide dismutase family protein [Deinococcus multiflagellatus]|uniref:Superoxide dismutase family protein n=1 Tax=Deinococcus multiflagellatus TaxID=1656887 RepID=A0ABW1ZRG3_9DEIO|nr:superoxide dismutase family protein [Deinococcus multiflagellatus]MBZ9714692.1 superoxide dismutase family protein [Deinococcus multiflagellatus]